MKMELKTAKYPILFTILLSIFYCKSIFPRSIYIESVKIRKSEIIMLKMINIERKKLGVEKLIFNFELRNAAKLHNLKMIKEEKLSHGFKGYPELGERLSETGLYFTAAGENIAYGSLYHPDFFHNGFMKSPKHAKNILNKKFSHCGISVVKSKNGYYVTQEFANIFSPENIKKLKRRLIGFIDTESFIRFRNKPKYSYAAEPYADNFSTALLNGEKTKSIPAELAGFSLVEILSPKINRFEKLISDVLKNGAVSKFSISVKFGRNRKNPGGTYTFVMLY